MKFILFFLTLCTIVQSHKSSMNVPSLLLPYPTKYHTVESTIQATNGCFKWSTSHPNIITLKPHGSSCSTSCTIQVHHSDHTERLQMAIYAEDEDQKVRLRTEVILDKIAKIEMVTTTRRMNKDDYEVMEIDGFDSIGNKFTTLEGIPVKWNVESVNGMKANGGNYIRIEKFSTADEVLRIRASEGVVDMEQMNYRTSKVLIKGLELGKERLIAQLALEPEKTTSVVVTVLQILAVVPENELFVMEGTKIPYKVFTTRRNEIGDQIKMPNQNYLWNSTNSQFVSIDNSGLASAAKLGRAAVSVMYKDTPESIVKRIVNVVKPEKIKLNWKDTTGTWQWVEGKTYEVVPELMDKSGNVISFVDGAVYEITINRGLEIVAHEEGYTKFTVKATKPGKPIIKAKLVKSAGIKAWKSVSCEQDIIVQSKVRAQPRFLKLAVPGAGGCLIKATGGSNEFVYSIEGNAAAITVDGSIFPKAKGKAKVIVRDSRNSENFDVVEIEAAEVASLEIKNSVVEALIGSSLNFTAVAKDVNGAEFDTCSVTSVEWKLSNTEIFEMGEINTIQSVQIHAKKAGSTILTARYGKGIAEVDVFSYEKATFTSLKTNPHVVMGSGFEVGYEGGPSPWYLNKKLYFVKLAEDPKIAVKFMDNNRMFVTCKEYGKGTLKIEVGNRNDDKQHNYTVSTTATLDYTCSKPEVLMMSTHNDFEDELVGKETERIQIPNICKERTVTGVKKVTNQMTVRVGEEIKMVGYVKPSVTGMFTNSSSVEYVWTTSDNRIAYVINQVDRYDHSEVVVVVGEEIGHVELTLKAIRYQRRYFKEVDLSSKKIDIQSDLIRTITLNIVEKPIVSPKAITLFNHPENTVVIQTRQGSGFYNCTTESDGIRIEQSQYDSKCTIIPRKESVAQVIVKDICFGRNAADDAVSLVTISDVHEVIITMTDQIEIEESTELTFEALDVNGKPFAKNQYKFMDIKVIADNSNILIEKKETTKYKLTGTNLGTTSVHVTINRVSSKKANIQVYDHFVCTPNEINLIPLAQEDIKCTGGPTYRATTEHRIVSGTAVHLNENKILGNYKGRSVIESQISYIDLLTKQRIVKGTSRCVVVVRHLTGLRMEAHQTTLEVGGQTKVTVIGEAEGVPVSIAATQLDFLWSQNDNMITQLFSVYHRSNITVNDEMSHTILVKAKKAGRSKIHVKVENIQKGLPQSYTELEASILITVVDPFTSMCGGNCRNVIDMAVHSHTQIKTNREAVYLDFSICDGKELITIDSKGMITSYGKSGSSVVHVTERDTGEMMSYVVKVHGINAIEMIPLNTRNGVSSGEKILFELVTIGERGRKLSPAYDKMVHFDVIPSESVSVTQIANLSIVEVTANKPGRTIVKVKSTEGVSLVDEVRITVHHSVTPTRPIVPVGATIRFKSVSNDPFVSEAKSVISIDAKGHAVAKGIGRAQISTVASTPAQTKVTVSQLESASLESVVVGSGRVLIPVTFYSHAGIITQDPEIKLNLVTKCVVEESHWATSRVEVIDGKYYCAVTSVMTSAPRPPEQIKLKFIAKDQTGKTVSTSVILPYKAGLTAYPPTLKMKPGKDARLELYRANGEVTVRDEYGRLRIREIERSNGKIVYEIGSLETCSGELEVFDSVETLKIPYDINNNNHHVPQRPMNGKHQQTKKSGNNMFLLFSFIILLVVVIIALLLYVC